MRRGDCVLGWQSCNRPESDEGWSHHQCRPAGWRSLSTCSHAQVVNGVLVVTAAASLVQPAVRIGGTSSTRTRDIPLAAIVAAGGNPWLV